MMGEERIRAIFNDLQNKELIRGKVGLTVDGAMPGSKASIFGGSIAMNPAYASLSDEGLRFILLHEEGHMILFQRTLAIMAFLAMILILVGLFLSDALATLPASAVGLAISVMTIVAVFRSTSLIRHEDEFQSDNHAAMILREVFGVQRPSLVAEECFSLEVLDSSDARFLSLMMSVLKTHPAIEERVARIRDTVDMVV